MHPMSSTLMPICWVAGERNWPLVARLRSQVRGILVILRMAALKLDLNLLRKEHDSFEEWRAGHSHVSPKGRGEASLVSTAINSSRRYLGTRARTNSGVQKEGNAQ